MTSEWRLPSICTVGGCVKVMLTPTGNVATASTRRPGVVFFNPDEWCDFVAAVKRGEFDLENLT